MKRQLALVLATLLLVGCGGGSGSSSPAPATPAKTQTQSVTGSVVISIPSGGQSSSSRVRFPQFVSPNAQSVALSVNGGADQFFNVAAGSSLCMTSAGGTRNCTLTFGAPVGTDSFGFLIWSGPNGTGTVLASAGVTQAIAAGVAFNFAVALNAAIGTVIANIPTNGGTQGNCPDGLPSFNGIVEGCAGNSGAVTFTVDDPSGATITGTAPFATPIVITTNDPSVTASPSQITAPGQTAVLTYSGAALGAAITNSVTVNLTIGTAVIPATVPVRRSYLYVANSNAPAGTTPTGGGNITVYTYGSTTPLRTITSGLSNPVQPLIDNSGDLWVLDNGPYATNSHPFINVYLPGTNVPAKQITAFAALDFNNACESMAMTPDQQKLFVTCDDGSIHVFPTNFTGAQTASSLQTVSMSDDSWSGPEVGMAFDNSGNLYVADTGFSAIDQYVVSTLPTSGSFVLIGAAHSMDSSFGSWPVNVDPVDLLVDNNGTLYASIIYFNSIPGGPDANNQIAIWPTTTIPCNNCTPSASLMGGASFQHAPAGIILDPAGNLYMSNPFTNQIIAYSKATVAAAAGAVNNPTVLRTINTGSSPGAPTGLAIGP